MRRLLVIIFTVALFLFALTSAANAGTYQVQSCNDGNHGGSNVWSYFSNNGNFLNWGDYCISGSGLMQSWLGTSDAPQGAAAGRFLDAPGGTYFSYLYWQQMMTGQGGGYRCVYATDSGGNIIGSSSCVPPTFSERSTGWVNQEGGANNTGRIYLYAACFGGPCNGGGSNRLTGQFGYANANISDPTSPGLYDLGGIWGKGWVRGSWPISWNASDSLGVKTHTFQVDGSQQAANQFCSPGYFGPGYYYGSSMQPCPNPGQGGYQSASFSVNTAAYSNGTHTLSAVTYDSTDNAGVANMTLYADNSTPSTPTFTSGPADGAWTNDATPTFGFTSSDPQSGIGGYRCQIDGGSLYNCSTPTTLPAQAEGSHQFCVQSFNNALDTGGTPAFSSLACTTFKVDTAPPAAFLAPAPQYIAASGTTLRGSASDPTSGIAEVKFQARPQGSSADWQTLCTKTSASPYSCAVDGSSLTNNTTYELRLLATNNAGTSAASDLETSLVDNQPPSAPSISSGPANNSWLASTSATYAFSSSDPVSGVNYYQCNQGSWQTCTSPKTFTGLASGMNNLSFRAVDNAGNISDPTNRAVGSDLIAPVLNLNNLPSDVSGTITVSGTATDTLSGVDSGSITLEIRSLPSGSFSDICNPPSQSGSDYSCSLDTNTVPDGDYQIRMTGQDNVGNQPSSWPTDNITIDNNGPTINLTVQDRVSVWQVTDPISGVDPTGFTAEFSDDSGVSWQAMDDPYWDPSDNKFRAAVPDVIPGNTTVEVRLEATSNSGATSTDTSSPFSLPLQPPVNDVRPVVSGTTTDGQQLTSDSGTWSGLPTITYQYYWLRCSLAGDDCVLRSSTSSDTTTLADGDVNHRIRSMVVATNPDGSNSEDSEPTAIVNALPPTPTAPPVVSGTAKQGETLSVSDGGWDGTTPFEFSYQWQRCSSGNCVNISGADQNQYTLTNSDVAKTVRAQVTASNASLPGGGSASQFSPESSEVNALAPSGAGLPLISGQAYSTATLSASTGDWQGSEPFSFSYQWLSCDSSGNNCSDISGADEASYTVLAGEIGNTIRVRVTADNSALPGGGSANQTSEASAVIADGNPSNTVQPTIEGVAKEGDQLDADPGTWQGLPPINLSYQWQRCQPGGCVDIDGATAQAYVAEYADVGYTLRVQVVGVNSASSLEAYSDQTAPVEETPDPPQLISSPDVSGSPDQGETLSVSNGTWGGRQPISYSYQWQRCQNSNCDDISLATNSSYTATAADIGYRLRAVVTATNVDGSNNADSSPTEPISPLLPENVAAPSISGGLDSGDQLTANPGSWVGQGTITYSYQWLRCPNQNGDNCQSVAEGVSYQLSAADVGSYIKLRVTATNSQGSTNDDSALHGPIVEQEVKPAGVQSPEISGLPEVGQVLSTSNGQWRSKTALTYSYRWQRCQTAEADSCQIIAGADKQSYTAQSADYNKYIRVSVAATNEAGTSAQLSDNTFKVIAPICTKATSVPSGSISLDGRRVKMTGSKAGYYGNGKLIKLSAKANRSGLRLSWLLSGQRLASTKKRSSVLKLNNQQLLLGKRTVSLVAERRGRSRTLSRQLTTQVCPGAITLTPKPAVRTIKISNRTNKAYVSQNYTALNYGRWRISGSRPSSVRWLLNGKRISTSRSFAVSPTLFKPGKQKISLTIKRGRQSRTVSWSVNAANYLGR